MPRKPQGIADNLHIESVIQACALQIEDAIRQAVAARIDDAVQEALRRYRGAEDGPGLTASGRRRRMCPVPDCGLPAAGPKYAWRCRAHKMVSRDEIDRLRAERAASGDEPAAQRITRLPPGPGPDRPRRPGPPMDCRVIGCLTRSKGPRYDYFCGLHYGMLSADERAQAAREWRAARDQARENAGDVVPRGPVIRRRPPETTAAGEKPPVFAALEALSLAPEPGTSEPAEEPSEPTGFPRIVADGE